MTDGQLGPYKIIEPLGAGGMGEVFLGEDTRLGRKVAIKVLPAEFAGDPERLARFEQEARAAAALNHPNIAVVHDVGAETGTDGETTHFIVQEYLEGDTLRRPIDVGPLPLKKMLALSVEIVEALGAAHAAGIVHRDLKPENIFITKDGHAKVLDFGLAKLTEIAPAVSGSASMSPTLLGTVAGQVMGTAGYMAPEQVDGEEVDARADLFAFGCVLYEMATGKRAFSGKNLPETLHRLVNTEPEPIGNVAPELPLQLAWIADKTLAKDRTERYQSAHELGVDVRRLAADVAAERTVSAGVVALAAAHNAAGVSTAEGRDADELRQGLLRPRAWWLPARLIPWAVTALALAIAYSVYSGAPTPNGGDNVPLFFPLERLPVETWSGRDRVSISPDGLRVVFPGDETLELLDLSAASDPEPLRHTENVSLPTFSPDGEWIAFEVDGEIRAVRPGGALPRTLARGIASQSFSLTWTDDDRILYTPAWDAPLYAVPAAGGQPLVLAAPDVELGEQIYAWASLLPGGEHLLYSMWDTNWNIAVRSLATDEARTLIPNAYDARFVPTGHLVFVQDEQLLAATFDLDTLEVGEPRVVRDGLVASFGSGWGAFDFSDNGTLVYLEGASESLRQLWRVDKGGARTLLTEGRRHFAWVDLSPDGRSIAVALRDPRRGSNAALFDIERDRLVPLTASDGWVSEPIFSADGTDLLYTVENSDFTGFRIRSLDGSEADVPASPDGTLASSAGRGGGDLIAFSRNSVEADNSSRDIWTLRPGSEPEPLIIGPDNTDQPMFSPDGEVLAYSSDRTGRQEIYVRRFPGTSEDEPWQVSVAGGGVPRWSADGTLWFINQGTVFAVDLVDGPQLRTTEPVAVFSGIDAQWDIAADGSYAVTLDRREPPKLRMVLNWFADLEAKVPHTKTTVARD